MMTCPPVPAYRRASLSGPTEAFVWPNRRRVFSPWLEGDAHEKDGGRGADRSLVDAVVRIR